MFSDSFKVLEQAFLGRAVIIRSDRQAADNTAVVKTFGQANRLCGCIGSRASDNWNTPSASSSVIITTSPCSSWLSVADSPVVPTEKRSPRFRWRHGNQSVFQACPADITVFIHRRDKRYNTSREHGPSSEQKCDKILNVTFGAAIKAGDPTPSGMLYGGFFMLS